MSHLSNSCPPPLNTVVSRIKAFTLAEVLITLGIVGIIAALTIPSLVQKYQIKTTETYIKRFYSNINEAVKLSEIENGDKKEWFQDIDGPYGEQTLTQFYNKYLSKYIKTTKVEYSSDKQRLLIYFADGSLSALEYYGHDILYFTSAKIYEKETFISGKDYFLFGFYPGGARGNRNLYFYNKGVEPYIPAEWDGTEQGLYGTNSYSKIIQNNGWRIPDDYPVKF